LPGAQLSADGTGGTSLMSFSPFQTWSGVRSAEVESMCGAQCQK
jgi:hypothetical protein